MDGIRGNTFPLLIEACEYNGIIRMIYWKYILKAVVFYGIVLVRDSLFQFMSLVLMGVKDERDIQKGEEVKTQENI